MATNAHTVPSVLPMSDGASFGEFSPGFQVTQYDTGPVMGREWFDGQLGSWQWSVPPRTAVQLNALRWYLRHVRNAGGITWLVEPLSRVHPPLVVGPLTDGTRYTFPAGTMAPADEAVFVGGAYQDGGYSVRAVANLLPSDNSANATSATTGLTTVGTTTIARSTDYAFDGCSSIWVKPGSSQPNIGVGTVPSSSFFAPVTAGRNYTVMASFLGAGEFKVQVFWYTAGGASVSNSTGATSSGSTTSPTVITETSTAPATAANAIVVATRTTDSALGFFVGCLALNPGDYDTWHLPSQAPGLVEFASAPAANARVTVASTGLRVARCILQPSNTWSVSSPGNVFPGSISLREAPEF